jgi:uncharacterized UPF0160 family protein
MEKLYQRVYKSFLLEVDAIDNGVHEAKDMKYHIASGLSERVSRYNGAWNSPAKLDYNV